MRKYDAFTGLERRDPRIDSYTGATLPEKRETRLDTSYHPTSLTIRVHAPWYAMDKAIREARREAVRNRRAMLRGRKIEDVKSTSGPRYLSKREVVERTLARLSPENRERLVAAMAAQYISVA